MGNLEEAIITKTDIGTLGFCNNKGHKIIEHISDQLIGQQDQMQDQSNMSIASDNDQVVICKKQANLEKQILKARLFKSYEKDQKVPTRVKSLPIGAHCKTFN